MSIWIISIMLTLKEAMAGADIFIGVSAPRIVTKEMVASMNEGNIVFAMANPEPEITYEEVKEAGAYIHWYWQIRLSKPGK